MRSRRGSWGPSSYSDSDSDLDSNTVSGVCARDRETTFVPPFYLFFLFLFFIFIFFFLLAITRPAATATVTATVGQQGQPPAGPSHQQNEQRNAPDKLTAACDFLYPSMGIGLDRVGAGAVAGAGTGACASAGAQRWAGA